ncbi:serine aminopeptidase domain-containing protein [Gordonia sp. (in: high G+C Gram-positive bacteria)]|uniref:alpha/beta hydrolase n=1 Tax=Gordonia sp. (in: high G+C Gram-positive bacteria) TaxID=84139 RepID=UPI001D938494|nr:alpha/beta hydrolase [Gordonia sp. (in: high G+C Gram-positive bacteria)]HQV18313.1 alpha/beta hydrolase [Gordonia sp. (in: high G+C Gram-positive bacteria)]
MPILTGAGFAVYGYDLRGHGANITPGAGRAEIGADGWPALVAAIGACARAVRRTHPGLKLGVLAHSMGLFATQQALPSDSHLFDAVALFARPYALSTVSPDLPMYLAVGEMDRPAGTRPGCWTRRICGIGAEVRPHTNRAVRQDLERMHADQPECARVRQVPG